MRPERRALFRSSMRLTLALVLAITWTWASAAAEEPSPAAARDTAPAPEVTPRTSEASPSGCPETSLRSPDGEASTRQACFDSFKRSQRLRRRGELLSARAELVSCGQPHCPDAIEAKCVEWVEEVRDAIPTIVVRAIDHTGRDVSDASLAVDGEVLSDALDGLALELDPGVHEIRISAGNRVAKQRVLVVRGAKDRSVELRFTAPVAAPPSVDTGGFRMPVLAWVGFGLGAAAGVIGTVTGISSLLQAEELECANNVCFQYQEDALARGRALAHASTASFAVSGAGVVLGVASLTWLRPPEPLHGNLKVRPVVGLQGLALEGRFW